MDFTLTPELKRAAGPRAVARRRRPAAATSPRPSSTTAGCRAEAHAHVKQAVLASGLNAANIPTQYGGGGLNLTEQIVMHEQLGRLTNCLWVLVWSPSNVLVHGTPEQIERYLLPDVRGDHRHAYAITEEHAGSDPRGDPRRGGAERRRLPACRARSGSSPTATSPATSWCWPGRSTGTERQPTLFIVDKDLPRRRDDRRSRLHAQLPLPAPRVHLHRRRRCRVDERARRGGAGFELTGEWFIEERVHIAARCVGACDRLIELGTAWALEREQFGSRIFDHQAISVHARRLRRRDDRRAAADLLRRLAGTTPAPTPSWCTRKASMAKLIASETAGRVADRVVQIFGGRGYMRSQPGRAAVARAARRPHLGGHQRDPAADHQPRAGAPGRAATAGAVDG